MIISRSSTAISLLSDILSSYCIDAASRASHCNYSVLYCRRGGNDRRDRPTQFSSLNNSLSTRTQHLCWPFLSSVIDVVNDGFLHAQPLQNQNHLWESERGSCDHFQIIESIMKSKTNDTALTRPLLKCCRMDGPTHQTDRAAGAIANALESILLLYADADMSTWKVNQRIRIDA